MAGGMRRGVDETRAGEVSATSKQRARCAQRAAMDAQRVLSHIGEAHIARSGTQSALAEPVSLPKPDVSPDGITPQAVPALPDPA
jgi:hypothetical protein